MPRSILRYLLILLSIQFVFAQKTTFKIKYISASHVYLQGGQADGLAVGDELVVLRSNNTIGHIRIEFVSKYSASAAILDMKQKFQVGDLAKIVKKVKSEVGKKEVKKDTVSVTQEAPVEQTKRKSTVNPELKTRIDGYLSLQYYSFRDQGRQNLNFNQPTARFRFRIHNLWNRSYHLEIRARSRYNQRQRRFSDQVPASEWQNRLYELTFSYDNPKAFLNYKLGRIISNAFSGVGYIDGALLNIKLISGLSAGAFAGTQPDWKTSNFQTEVQKYGGFLNYQKGDFSTRKLNVMLAGAGEYHGTTVSREFLYFQTSYYHGRRWSFYQNLELDLNRSWRKERTGQSVSLSGLYLNASYHITSKISTSLSYDNRKNYYTYELRSLADSLFDDAFRHGLRLNFYMNALKNYQISMNFGIREKSTDARYSYTYGLNVRRRNLFSRYNHLSFRFSGFDNVFATGFNPNLTFSRYFWGGHYLTLSYGGYYYQIKNVNNNRLNQWLRLTGQLELPARFYLNSTLEYDWGHDLKGQRILVELGYRF